MRNPPPAPGSWRKTDTAPYGGDKEGWVAVYKTTRNGHLAHMEVTWDGPGTDTVEIDVYEFPGAEPDHGNKEQIFDITAPLSDVSRKMNEISESWIKAIDNS